MSKAHPGFKGAAAAVAKKEHMPMENARRVIGAAKRDASPAARKANPRLNRTGGKK